MVLDLALLDATGDGQCWDQAVERALDVATRLAPDPQHGGLIYLPGRLDPRNCSNSVIDSGECTDALARLLLHPRSATLPRHTLNVLEQTVVGNAGTYLFQKVRDTEITNQRLWGAMGLATAARLAGNADWAAAVDEAVTRALDEQHPDGSWGYQPGAVTQGAFPGAADLTVYYHGRCLAFLCHILECLPALERPRLDAALRRGFALLAAVTTPDGRKPLALEGKRWFWASRAEAGSNAYDVYALLRGAERCGVAAWRDLAGRAWAQLARHQAPDGSVVAGGGAGTPDVVCPTFHTADLAWTAQVLDRLPSAPAAPWTDTSSDTSSPDAVQVRHFPDAGVLRIQNALAVALVRTRKRPRNTQWGGAFGGTLVYVGDTAAGADRLCLDRESAVVEGSFTLYPLRPGRLRAVQRFRRSDPPGREGRQWLFVARLLAMQGHPGDAARRLWRGYFAALRAALRDPAATHWMLAPDVTVEPSGTVRLQGQPARPGGDIPPWGAGIVLTREYVMRGSSLGVTDRLAREEAGGPGGPAGPEIVYLVPAAAGDLTVAASEPFIRRGPSGREIVLRPSGAAFFMRLTYRLA